MNRRMDEEGRQDPQVVLRRTPLGRYADPAEVAEVIELPFRHLLDPRTVENEVWLLRGERRRVGFYRHGEHKIWGATGKVLRQIVERAGGPPASCGLVPPGEVEPEVATAQLRFARSDKRRRTNEEGTD
jgi:hypothetical protein